MKKTKKAVTLVELIVWVSLSMLLMVSIWIFTSSGLSNLFLQEKSIWNIFSINKFIEETKNTLDNIDSESQILTNWIIFKRKTEYDEGWFAYIWTTEKDFCENWQKTKHIFIKNFIPFSEDKIKTWNFESKTKQNQVFENWNLIIWTKFFWKDFENWSESKEVPLNNPTWIVKDSEGNLFISDTLNDRILIKDKNWKVYNFLWNEILKEPNSLQFENWKLKIANAWKKEILEYYFSEKSYNPKNLKIEKNKDFFDKIKINITKDYSKKYNILEIKDEEKFSENFDLKIQEIKNIFQNDFIIKEDNEIYYQVWAKNSWKYDIKYISKSEYENQKSNLEFLWKTRKSFYLIPKDFSNFYNFTETTNKINNISWFKKLVLWTKNIFTKENKFYLEKTENKTITREDWSSENIEEKNYYELQNFKIKFDLNSYFSSSNNFIEKSNLKWKYFLNLEILKEISVNKFEKIEETKEEKIFENDLENFKITKTWKYSYDFWKNFDLNNPWNFINFDENYDKILDLPIKSLEISKNWDFINIILKYYKNFDCENLDINEWKIRTLFLKKKIN